MRLSDESVDYGRIVRSAAGAFSPDEIVSARNGADRSCRHGTATDELLGVKYCLSQDSARKLDAEQQAKARRAPGPVAVDLRPTTPQAAERRPAAPQPKTPALDAFAAEAQQIGAEMKQLVAGASAVPSTPPPPPPPPHPPAGAPPRPAAAPSEQDFARSLQDISKELDEVSKALQSLRA